MTRTDGKDCEAAKMEIEHHDAETSMGQVLQVAVCQALDQGRLICGVQECAKLLEIDPFNAMLCVLPDSTKSTKNSAEVSAEIHHMLIEAFCHEYDIRLIKVDSLAKLANVINSHKAVDNGTAVKRSVTVADVDCLLMQYPQHAASHEDETLAEFYKSSLFTDEPNTCVIELPD